jgi:hypothetical protein
MKSVVRRKLEMAAGVREFMRAHASGEPGQFIALARFEEMLTRAGEIATRQEEGRAAERAARAQRKELRRVLHFQLIRFLVAVGAVVARDRVELAERFKLPHSGATNSAFLASVKALLAVAATQKELLVQEGMSPTLLDDLGRMVSQFETAIEAIRTGRRDHIESRAELDRITSELADRVAVLDGVVRVRFGDDPEVMAGWHAAKRVPGIGQGGRKLTPPAIEEPKPAPGDGVVPPSSGGVAPAA